jgi:AraC family transcriptional regulator of adaptative response/methylated-DNA-[protein]-cysteine methyltransferase
MIQQSTTRQERDGAPDTAALMRALAAYIERNATQPLPLAHLAAQAHLSPAHLQRTFKAHLGVSPKAFHDAARFALLKRGLRDGKKVIDAITDAGFESTSRVYGSTTRSLGMTPSTYRDGGAGETITHAFRDTAFGPLLLAATDRGVCFAQFGADEAALVAQLQSEFPRAVLGGFPGREAPELEAWIESLEAHLAGTAARPSIPLDLRGTTFQIRVWKFLLGVPEGAVMSYGEVARGIGSPRAIRATASACSANRVAVLVPCHRVLRADGKLGGYRWGIVRKRTLIARERARAALSAEHGTGRTRPAGCAR